MNTIKYIILIVLIFLVSCNQAQTPKTPVEMNTKHQIEITDCGITYNGKFLDFDTPLSEWEMVLGKYNRDTRFILWDSIGIGISLDWQDDKNVSEFYVFFQNMDDEEEMLDFGKEYFEKMKDYPYPFNTYQDGLSLHGALIGRGMGIEEIQSKLDKTSKAGKLKYLDRYNKSIRSYVYNGYGVNGEYTIPTKTFCKGRRYSIRISNSPFIKLSEPIHKDLMAWQPAIEYIRVKELNSDDYYRNGKQKLLEGFKTKDKELIKQATEILQRAIERKPLLKNETDSINYKNGAEKAKELLKKHKLDIR